MEITNSSIAAIVAAIVAIVFIVLYINTNESLKTALAQSEKLKAELLIANTSLQTSLAECKKLKVDLSNTSIELVKYKNDPQRTEGATRVILNLLLFETLLANTVYRNPKIKVGGDLAADYLPELKKEIEEMRSFQRTFTSSEVFKSTLKTLGATNESEFKEIMLKRVDGFTSLDISGFLKRNNIGWN